MSSHLSEADLIDVLMEAGDARAREHAAECAHCRARLDHAREGLRFAREAEVPEPSPIYWQALRRQVDRRIGVGEPAFRGWRLGPVLAAAAAALAVVSLLRVPPAPPRGVSVTALPAWSALPPSEDDPGLALIEGLAARLGDTGAAPECSRLAECIAGLSEAESQALVDVLRDEIEKRPS